MEFDGTEQLEQRMGKAFETPIHKSINKANYRTIENLRPVAMQVPYPDMTFIFVREPGRQYVAEIESIYDSIAKRQN